MEVESVPAVEMRGVWKTYPDGTVALRGVDFVVRQGEIHGLLGENGAGKTTLMRILYGEVRPTRGTIKVFGKEVKFRGPWDAMRLGISMVYQHFRLVPTFTVLENLHLAITNLGLKWDLGTLRRRAEELIERVKLKVPLERTVEELPVGVQQRVEILKALLLGSKILILDEPTSVLTPIEVRDLFKVLKKLKEGGMTIIFISHKLREVKAITDKVTVLRKGKVVGVLDTGTVSEVDLAKMMVGRGEIVSDFQRLKVGVEARETALKVEDLWVKDDRGIYAVKGISFELREGEILGIAGVQGNGQQELAEAIAGIRRVERGRIILRGVEVTELPARVRYEMGLAYIPDSREVGLVLDMNLPENSILTHLRKFLTKFNVISWGDARGFTKEVISKFKVVAPSTDAVLRYLSGGNQQKVLVGREILRGTSVYVFCEPTHGLDVGATEFIRKTLVSLRNEGKAVLLISTDLDEILQLSDRIAVMYEGRIMALKRANEFTIEELGLLMGGVRAQEVST